MNKQQALSVNKTEAGAFSCFGRLAGFVFCTLFFGMGLLATWVTAIGPTIKVLEAGAWVETPCTIVSSEVEGDETYSVAITFDYEFRGAEYTGDQYNFYDVSTGNRKPKEQIVEQYEVGSEQVCYVNPNDPAEAVLSRQFSNAAWFGLIGVPFMLVGLVGYIFLFFSGPSRANQKTNQSGLSIGEEEINLGDEALDDDELEFKAGLLEPMEPSRVATRSEWSSSEYDEEDLYEEPGPIKLESDSHPLVAFGCLLTFGLIWNGIVSIFVFQRIGNWIKLEFDGFEDLFLLPFILVGIGVIIGAIYSLMAVFNPRPELMLSRQLIPLGGSARVQWNFESGIGSLRKLSFRLTGVEEARYRRGTNTYTDKNEFYNEIVYETQMPIEMSRGEAEVLIPTDTMHSFYATDNSIKWVLQLHGDIPLWPDIRANFPIRVVPHE